ncbi:hypothetical protein BU17DRAFT_90862 [Hysterangium stoloniferum]|nr:hypothetical protein BU17DRAFT_90862 [Hysterangium stoloniferum]
MSNSQVSDTWNSDAANAAASSNLPDSTGLSTATGTISSSATAASSTGTSAPSSQSVSHTGAIAGGVVGGIIVTAMLILGGILFYRRRNRKQQAVEEIPKARFVNERVDLVSSPTTTVASNLPLLGQGVQPKLYNPDDPSTFPPRPVPSVSMIISSPTATGSHGENALNNFGHVPVGSEGSTGYTGAAEI